MVDPPFYQPALIIEPHASTGRVSFGGEWNSKYQVFVLGDLDMFLRPAPTN